jgi:ribonucleases P/MRP protein subunit RPP40
MKSGFRTHHITSTALLKITNDLLIATDERLVSLLVFLGFSIAFDSVNHHLLCSKLSDQFDFNTIAVRLIMSYVSNRSQCADVLPITSGVVQGSVLGTLLFSMIINDIVLQIPSCRVHFYADDVSCEPQHIKNCIRYFNMDLDRVHCWSIENCLAINPKKSQTLLINQSILLVSPLLLGTNHIAFLNKVEKKLGHHL